jgi:hypothetical protein
MSIVLQSSGGGQITIQEPATASNFTQTLPAATGTVMVSGSQPAFSATRTAAQSISATTYTKIQFSTEDFDTASCFNNTGSTVGGIPAYAFLPNVAGYYQITVNASTNSTQAVAVSVYKNGTRYRENYTSNPGIGASSLITSLVFMNGTTDYVEGYIWQNDASSLYTNAIYYEFSGCLVRAA